MNDLDKKAKEQAKIDRDKEEFYRNGGKNIEVPYGVGQSIKTKEEIIKNSWREDSIK